MSGHSVEVDSLVEALPAELLDGVEHAARLALAEERAGDTVLSITLVDDAEIARINAEFLHHEGPTDVISFPLTQPAGPLVGDIYIGVDQARRQADEIGIPWREEVLRLAIHGVLHVLGWNHPEDEGRERSPMYTRQEELVAKLRAGDPGQGVSGS